MAETDYATGFLCAGCNAEFVNGARHRSSRCERCGFLVCDSCMHEPGHGCERCARATVETASPVPETSWIELPVVRACIEKWNRGREKHGPVFVGDPLAELYAELIDAVNYENEARLENPTVQLDGLADALISWANLVRQAWLEQRGACMLPEVRRGAAGV